MNERPIGYGVAISISDSEGNTADFTLENTERGTTVVAACDFPVPNDALAQSLALAAFAICEHKPSSALLDRAVSALHAQLTAVLKAETALKEQRSVNDADAPF